MSTSTRARSPQPAAQARTHRAYRRTRYLTRKRITAAVLVLVLLAIGGLGLAADAYAQAFQGAVTSDLRQAAANLEAGKADLRKGTGDQVAAERHFRAARAKFVSARHRVDADPFLPHLMVGAAGGYLGPRLKAVRAISDMGVAVADAGIDALPMQEALAGADPSEKGLSAGQRLVTFLKGSTPNLQVLERDLQRASTAAAAVDARYLPSSQRAAFAAAKQTIETGLAGIKSLRESLPGLLEILGANGARTYLIEQMNPAELRPGGGFIGSYGILRVDGGKFGIIQSAGIADADYPRPDVLNHCIDARYNPTPCKGHTYVKPPVEMMEFLGDKSWVLGDSNFWPDFPTNARAAQTLTDKELKTKVDGVIAIDPQFLAGLLKATGPIQIPGYNFTADPKTFTKDLFEYENSRTAGPATVRKALFTDLAPVLIDKVTTLPAGRWGDLLKVLNDAAASHDLQVYFNADPAQKLVGNYGWGGVQPASSAPDFMMETESNMGGTKANQFVTRTYDVQLTAAGNTLHHKVTVNLTNSMPDGKYEGKTFYRFYARFYYPATGTDGKASNTVSDKYRTDEKPPAGLRMVDGWQQVNVNPARGSGSDHITFEYDTPYEAGMVHDIYWQKQAGTQADKVSISFTVNGSTRKVEGDLAQDRVIHLSGDTVTLAPGVTGSAKLPGISL